MVKINLLLSNYETAIDLELENSSDFNNFIISELGLENYVLKLEDGSKRNSKNILLIDDFLKNKVDIINPEKDKVNILLEINKKLKVFQSPIVNNLQSKKYFSNAKQDYENFVNFLNTNKIKSDCLQKIYEKTLSIIDNSHKIRNQKSIYDFYFNYNKVKLEKVKSNLEKKANFLIDMKNFNYDLKENLQSKYMKEFKSLKLGNLSVHDILRNSKIFNLELMEPKYKDFIKSLEAYEIKIKTIEQSFKKIEESSNLKLSVSKVRFLSYDLEDFIKTQFEYFVNEFKRIIKENNDIKNLSNRNENNELYSDYNPKSLFRDMLASFENFWKNLNENHLKAELLSIESIKDENTKKLNDLIEDDFEKKIKELNIKCNELHLLKKNIHINYDYLSIPILATKQFSLIEKEINRRRKLEFIFNNILILLKEKFLEKEEEYVKRFNSEMSQYSKSNMSKFLFKHLSENFDYETLYSDKHLNKSFNDTANNFEAILENIFEIKSRTNTHNTKQVIDINSADINENLNTEPAKSKYYDINDSKFYLNKNENINNEKMNNNNNYEDINEVSFNNNNNHYVKDKVFLNNQDNYNSNINKVSNNNTFMTPPTPTLNNLSLSNQNMNINNINQNNLFEEWENLLNNLNEKVLGIQKDLNSLLINVHKYSEKDLLQIDLNQKFSLKNSFSNNTIMINNNDTFINLNLENKNSENILEDSLFLTHKDSKKRNFDETNTINKNSISCNHILANYPNTNLIYTVENIFTNIFKIKAYLKLLNKSSDQKLNEGNKEEDLDFSMNSLINSIYISKVVLNQKTKINDFENEDNKNNENYIMKQIRSVHNEYNINDSTDLAAFVKMHVHKIYFYDDIYNMLQNFIEKRNIKYDLNKDNCDTVGRFIESLIKKYIKLSNEYPNLIKKIMETYKKK